MAASPSGARLARWKRFASYTEFEQFGKEAGLQSSTDFLRFCRLNKRPKNIPSRPDHTYRGCGWVSWKHAFGVSSSAKKATQTSGLDLPLKLRQKRRLKIDNFERAYAWFLSLLRQEDRSSSWFDFVRLGRGPGPNLLFRCRDGDHGQHEDAWAAMQVKSCQGYRRKPSHKTEYRFRNVVADTERVGFLALCDSRGTVAVLSPPEIADCRTPAGYVNIASSERQYPAVDAMQPPLPEQIRALWKTLPRKSLEEWAMEQGALGIVDNRYNVCLHNSLALQAAFRIYLPAQLACVPAYEISGKQNQIVAIAGLSCIQKACINNNGVSNAIGKLTRPFRLVDGSIRRICYNASQEIDAFIFFVRRESVLMGLFFLPKLYLSQNGFLVDGQGGGKTCITLYPPGIERRRLNKVAQREAERQRNFFIDCAGGVASPESIEQLRHLVQQVKRGDRPIIQASAAVSRAACNEVEGASESAASIFSALDVQEDGSSSCLES